MIALTDQLGNLVYVNPDHISSMHLSNLQTACTLTDVANYKDIEYHPAVKIVFSNGRTLIVENCLRDIREQIQNTPSEG